MRSDFQRNECSCSLSLFLYVVIIRNSATAVRTRAYGIQYSTQCKCKNVNVKFRIYYFGTTVLRINVITYNIIYYKIYTILISLLPADAAGGTWYLVMVSGCVDSSDRLLATGILRGELFSNGTLH